MAHFYNTYSQAHTLTLSLPNVQEKALLLARVSLDYVARARDCANFILSNRHHNAQATMPVTRKRTTTTTTGTARRKYISRASTRASRAAGFANTRLGFSVANPEQPLAGPRRSYQRPESKYFDTTLTTTWNGSGGPTTVNVLNLPSQGTASNQRIGNSISCKSLEIVGSVFLGTAQISPQTCRMIVCWDHQPDPAGVVTPLSPALLFNPTPDGLLNVNNTDRYTILLDRMFYITPGVTSTYTSKPIHIYIPLKNVESRHTSGGTFPTTNSLCIYTFGDTVAGVNTNPLWIAQARLRFIDS